MLEVVLLTYKDYEHVILIDITNYFSKDLYQCTLFLSNSIAKALLLILFPSPDIMCLINFRPYDVFYLLFLLH